MRILDCFSYFNEVETLKLRIDLLHDKVDKFIITESDHTHKGDYKGFSLKKDLTRFGLNTDKIKVIEVQCPSFKMESNAWIRERMQRNAAAEFISGDDAAIISDCDEIINPEMIDYYVSVAKQYPNNILRIPMDFLMARADLKAYDQKGNSIDWSAPFICLEKHLSKLTLSDLRESHSLNIETEFSSIFITEDNKIKSAGWHFSWMGNNKRHKTKKDSFLHWNEVELQQNFNPKEGSTDPLGRQDHILKKYPLSSLPKIILEEKYFKDFFLPEDSEDFTSLMQILELEPFLNTDKNTVFYKNYPEKWPWLQYHSYIINCYEKEFYKFKSLKNVRLLEIGIDIGGSIALWSKYFNDGLIVGLDITSERIDENYKQSNFNNVVHIITDAYGENIVKILPKFDIIIDDGPHTLESQIKCIQNYLPLVNDNGLMIIEDIPEMSWIDILKSYIPDNVSSDVVDLRVEDNQYDSLILIIKK